MKPSKPAGFYYFYDMAFYKFPSLGEFYPDYKCILKISSKFYENIRSLLIN